MIEEHPALSTGYHALPPGKIATIVTFLEMHARPAVRPVRDPGAFAWTRWHPASLDEYRALFREVGEYWLWESRLVMPDEKLNAILTHPQIELYTLQDQGRPVGLVELDFREEAECELVFFGLVGDAIGKGAGRVMMNQAIDTAWSRPIKRFWVHTCHLDSPEALPFYQRSGFTPYALKVEVLNDPRLMGLLPRSAAPNVPVIDP
jgi:Acetyltransferase (GNAT) family.